VVNVPSSFTGSVIARLIFRELRITGTASRLVVRSDSSLSRRNRCCGETGWKLLAGSESDQGEMRLHFERRVKRSGGAGKGRWCGFDEGAGVTAANQGLGRSGRLMAFADMGVPALFMLARPTQASLFKGGKNAYSNRRPIACMPALKD